MLTPITRGELACWELRHRHQRLVIAEQGAQVLEYRHDGEPPLIWLSDRAAYHQGQSVRGGIPVCWPWFGALERNPEAVCRQHPGQSDPPAHGLVRQRPWTLVDHRQEGDDQVLHWQAPPVLDGVSLTLTVRLGEHLTLALTNHNHGPHPVAISQALHSYLAVGDSRRVTINGLEGCPYVDALDQWQRHTQAGPLTPKDETDRLYLGLPATLEVEDPVWRRRLRIQSSGSHSAVVWNPGPGKSRRLSQFRPDAWREMLCIETARVLEDHLPLGPGETQTLTQRLSSRPL